MAVAMIEGAERTSALLPGQTLDRFPKVAPEDGQDRSEDSPESGR
jgi:hypothetical protein